MQSRSQRFCSPVYRYAFSAVSDEWLLDKQAAPLSGAGLAQSGGELLRTLTNRVDAGLFTTTGVMDGLSVGVFEPTPSWGLMLRGAGMQFLEQAPWLAIAPGVAISLAVFGFNLFGDSLRDALDPRLRTA